MRIQSSQQKYVNQLFGLEDDSELKSVREELARRGCEHMSISGAEARILQFFVRATGVKKIVEVGMLFGYSAIAMAKALPADGVLYSLEKNPVNFETAKKFFDNSPVGGRIRPMSGDALETLKSLEGEGPFDLVFIDADKANYANYLTWAEQNVRQGGYIVGDNTFLWGGVWDELTDRDVSDRAVAAMKEFNLRLADSRKYNSTIIPTAEGMTFAQKL